jgi:hypothetical protein
MGIKRFAVMTGILFSLNGSLDTVINDNYGAAKAASNPYMIDYLMHWNDPNYVPCVNLDWVFT